MAAETEHPAAIEDPTWVTQKYEEAKELVEDIRADIVAGRATVEPDVRERLEEFWVSTFMDRCTTFGLDCGCNSGR